MRVLFNTTAALEGTSGFTQTVELLSAISRLGTPHSIAVLTTPSQEVLRAALGDAGLDHVIADVPRHAVARTAALYARLPGLIRSARADALYNRGNFYAPRPGCLQIVLLENANPFSTLSFPSAPAARLRNRLLRMMSNAALDYASAVVFPSRTAKDCVASRRPITARTFVIPHGADMPPPPSASRAVADPYILIAGSLFPFKNLTVAIDAFSRLRGRGAFEGRLVLVGDRGPDAYVNALMQAIASKGLADAVTIAAPVARPVLTSWYRHAAATLTTSLEETFGLPVVEAMSCGAPVVAPDTAPADPPLFLPFRELCGDAAEYFNPFDAGSCAEALARAIREPRRSQLVAAGMARVRDYSWDAAARRTVAMFTELDASRSCSGNGPRDTTGTAG